MEGSEELFHVEHAKDGQIEGGGFFLRIKVKKQGSKMALNAF